LKPIGGRLLLELGGLRIAMRIREQVDEPRVRGGPSARERRGLTEAIAFAMFPSIGTSQRRV
jgi:hypothetical protein